MNTSVASLAPKHKHYSSTPSLDTRVAIADVVQVLVCEKLWRCIFDTLGLDVDYNVLHGWKERDKMKEVKTKRESSIEGKPRKSKLKYAKLSRLQKDALKSFKKGLGYESGLALSAVAKVLENSPEFKLMEV